MNYKIWFHGLASVAISGMANAITVMIIDPAKFNLQSGWPNLLEAALISGILAAAFYLKKSPLPDEPEDKSEPPKPTTSTTTTTQP